MTATTLGGITWDRFPTRKDPRIPFVMIMITYVTLGVTVLGFNRSFAQIAAIVGTTCLLDTLFSIIFRRKVLFPLSSAITGLGLSILVNTAHGVWFAFIPAFFAVASKYLITVKGRHVFNPNLFGLLVGVTIGGGMISPSPAYQWGGYYALCAFIVTAALVLFVFKIKRNALILSFLAFYSINLAIRGYLTSHHVPFETIVLGALTSPAFYLFTFFMITDPATSPQSTRGQIFMSAFIAIVDLILHKFEALSTLFKAGFLFYSVMFFYRLWESRTAADITWWKRVAGYAPRLAGIPLVAILGVGAYKAAHSFSLVSQPNFSFSRIDTEALGMLATPSKVMEEVDPRVQHLAKWIMAQGDGVAIGDANNDGLQDVFVSYSLKVKEARSALYLNKGNFTFERFPLPAIADLIEHYQEEGLAAGGLWLDYDNDGDKDLWVIVGFGYGRMLRNDLMETGQLGFTDVTEQEGLRIYSTSMRAVASDLDQNGRLDLLIANSLTVKLDGYEQDTYLNLFHLPAPEYDGDRRAVHFMHRTWHDANNGGENYLFINQGDRFERQDNQAWGFEGTRWTLDMTAGDLNQDGWPDLYLANDFGPDQLLMNQNGKGFKSIRGPFVGEMGHDTYKGMNSTMADMNNDGLLDVYVSNVHVKLQAEGSMLWINKGTVDTEGYRGFDDQAMGMNILNESRFGWGAAVGDLDRDGRMDLVQANGMVNNNYDKLYEGCPDYWYWNDKIALTGPHIHGYADMYADLRGRCIFPQDKKRVYLNIGKYFVDVADMVGLNDAEVARGVATADMDNDGDLDVLISQPFAPLAMYRNDAHEDTPWAGIRLVGNGTTCNKDAVGTKVTLRYDADDHGMPLQYREVMASNGLASQSDQRLLFGLGHYRDDVHVDVQWCGRGETVRYALQTDRYQTLTQ